MQEDAMTIFIKRIAILGLMTFLAACASGRNLGEQRTELVNFRLGHVAVHAGDAVQGPASRSAEAADWERTLEAEVRRRFARYEGERFYHLAIGVEGYVLAIPGIPLVLAPKSALIFSVVVRDDATGERLNERPHRITVLESLSGETAISSGLTQSAEQQMKNLTENGVAAIERWLASNPDWFPAPEPSPEAEPTTPKSNGA
jgi:hypothetical protein